MKTRTLWRILALILLAGGGLFHPAYPTFAQEGDGAPPLTFDSSANPPQAKVGEDINVQFVLVGNPDVCDPVETRRPLDIVLVVDRSGSMEDPLGQDFQGSKLEGAIQAMDNFLEVVDPNEDRVALVSFAGSGAELTDLGGAAQVRAAFADYREGTSISGSGTNIEAGIRTAASLLARRARPATAASSVMILLTDGQQTDGDAASAAIDAKANDIRLITIGLGPGVDENLLRHVATQPSDYYYAPETSDLKSIYESIVLSIQTFDPATEVQVKYHFDASNFDLVEDSVSPPAEVSVNTVTWRFDTLKNNQQKMYLTLQARVPGTYYAAPNTELSYLACGQVPTQEQFFNRYPIEVIAGEGTTAPVCAGLPAVEPGLLTKICAIPWGWLGGLLAGLALLLHWLAKHRGQLRAWRRCRTSLDRCALAKLPLRLWLAVLVGLVIHVIAGWMCAPREGIIFWRVLPDRTSAIYIKPTLPDLPTKPLTPLVGEDQCVGCHTSSESNQTIAGIAQGTNGLLTRFDFNGTEVAIPSLQGSYPSWSPDGRKLAFAANNEDIYILDAETGIALPLPGASDAGVVETMPAWNADGSRIAFVRAAGVNQNVTITTPSDILSVPAQGGVPTLVPGASGLGFNYHPSYSPDGKWLAFTHHETGATTYGEPQAEIFIVPADGGAPRRLRANDGPGGQRIEDAGNTYPTWSRDGQHLLFSSRRCDDQYDIYLTKIDENGNSGVAERLTTVSDPQAFEYGAHEVHFVRPSLLERFLSLWPWLLPLLLFWLVLWLVCRPKRAQRDKDTVQVNTTVKPSEGWLRPRQRFEVTLEMYGIPFCEYQVVKRKVDAVLLIDSSGSMGWSDMGGKTRLSAAKLAARRFVRCVLGETERVAVVNFDSETKVQQGLTNRERSLLKAIQAIEVAGSTAMHLGLEKAAEVLQQNARADAVRVIILLSDGEPDDPAAAISTAEKIRESGVRVMTVGIGEADATLLQAVAGDTGSYRYASDRDGLVEAFLEAGRLLIMPPAATQLTLTHHYDAEKFELIPGSVIPQPQHQAPGVLAWQINELDTRPRYFRYLVRPLEAGEHYIDHPSGEVSYKRCGIGQPRRMVVPPAALVTVKQFKIDIPIKRKEESAPKFRYKEPEAVWQPDRAVFIGVGGTGRWVLTHLRKNLLDAGGGRLLDGLTFLVVDTDEREKISGQEVPVNIAGVEVPPEDVFVLDENLRHQISRWAEQDEPLAEHRGWFDSRQYLGLDQEINLANGTYGRRALPRVALLRNLQSAENPASRWYARRHQEQKETDLRTWLYQRCQSAYRRDRDQVRIFVVGSLAGGMSGILIDLANLARKIADQIVTEAGNVRVEGYLLDGMPFLGLPGGQGADQQRLANTFASWREIARWQLNPGMPFDPGWGEESQLAQSTFDDIVLFSGRSSSLTYLQDNLHPAMADVITARLDRATGAGEDADWFNQMQRARSDRQRNEHALIVGAAGVHMIRLPVADILRTLHARWAHALIRLFLTGSENREVDFDPALISDPGFTGDPASYVAIFLNSVGEFGGQAPIESQALADYLLMETSDLADSKDLNTALTRGDDSIRENISRRLNEAVQHILYGSEKASPTGSRAARLQYAIQVLERFADKMRALQAQLEHEWDKPALARVAHIYQAVAEERVANLLHLRRLLSSTQPDAPHGLLEELDQISTRLEGIKDDLTRLKTRQYFWGMLKQDADGRPREIPFMEVWWDRYLAGTVEAHLPYLGWVDSNGEELDLELRLEDAPIRLGEHGINAIVDGLMHMAASLTCDVWQEAVLADVLQNHQVFKSQKAGRSLREKTNVMGILGAQGDPGVAQGRVLFIAPPSVQNVAAGSAFLETLQQRHPGEMIHINYSTLNGTDRTSVMVLQLLDALRADRIAGYLEAEATYDRVDGWDAQRRRFVTGQAEERAVMRPEGEARRLEWGIGFPHTADRVSHKLHPLVAAALQSPARAELFCLALADGLVQADQRGQIVLQGSASPPPLVLLKDERGAVDPHVEALLNWTLQPLSGWEAWEAWLNERYKDAVAVDRSRMARYQLNQRRNRPERDSLDKLVTAIVRYFIRTGTRRW